MFQSLPNLPFFLQLLFDLLHIVCICCSLQCCWNFSRWQQSRQPLHLHRHAVRYLQVILTVVVTLAQHCRLPFTLLSSWAVSSVFIHCWHALLLLLCGLIYRRSVCVAAVFCASCLEEHLCVFVCVWRPVVTVGVVLPCSQIAGRHVTA